MKTYRVTFLELHQMELCVTAADEDHALQQAIADQERAKCVSIECDYYETEELP